MRPAVLGNPGPWEPYDERDTVFARARLAAGTDAHADYYARRPEWREGDDRTRRLRTLAAPGTQRYRAGEAVLVEALFEASDLVAEAVEAAGDAPGAMGTPDGLGPASAADTPPHRLADGGPEAVTRYVREAARFLGADDVGVAPLDPAFVYTHRGRPLARHGEPVTLSHPRAVVLVFAMRGDYVLAGPEMVSAAETARVYQVAAAASHTLAAALRRLGFAARAHVDSNYLVICPPLAVAAGLGELGRNGFLVHKRLGPGVRLGVVTTDAPLRADAEGGWGIAAFCRTCAKCARNCPADAIPAGDTTVVRGAEKWPLDATKCYHYWRTQGTDCGVCIRSCPFAKPDAPLHRLVRWIVARTTLLDRFLLWADDLVYGAAAPPKAPPLLGIGREERP
ncbi:MAG: 4Fe-4S dicluster domain-containing protein [Candidatus Krumholzibacteriota bacterium]|nr:4Fe-4S dicluster domain-containing protein [Candidatus Krumholzibacteriota bacterium]